MLGWLFKRQRTEHPGGVDALARVGDYDDTPRYPPFARGIPAPSVGRVLKTQEQLIRELRHSVGLAPESFDALIWPVLERLAGWMHLLPASEAHHHRMMGGLIRHSLEVGWYAARAAEGTVFVPMATPLERRAREPRWHAAVTIAGLLHDIGKPVSDMAVTNAAGEQWNPYTDSLIDWLAQKRIERYFIQWRGGRGRRHEQFAGLVAERLLPEETNSWLAEGGPEILEYLLSTITATTTDTHFARIVFDADQASVERDMRANTSPDEPSLGVPVDRHLLDVMRRLIHDGAWRTNEPGARVWVLNEGVFVVWERATEDILEYLKRDRIPGIPRHPDALADALIERGHADTRVLDDGSWYRYWLVQPACVGRGNVVLKALKLASAELIWPESEPPSVVAAYVGERVKTDHVSSELSVGAAPASIVGDTANGASNAPTAPTAPGNKPSMPRLPGTSQPTPESTPVSEGTASANSEPIGTRLTVSRPTCQEGGSADAPSEAEATGEPDASSVPEEPIPETTGDGSTAPGGPMAPSDAPNPEADRAGAAMHEEEGRAQPEVAQVAASVNPDPDDSLETFRAEGPAAAVLAALVDDIRAGRQALPEVFVETSVGLLLRYPDPVRPHVGKPNKLVQWLKAADDVEPDPDNALRPVRTVGQHSGLVLKRALAQRLRPILNPQQTTNNQQELAMDHPTEPTPEPANSPQPEPPPEPEPSRPARPRVRRGPGTPSSTDLAHDQATSALERLVATVRERPDDLPGDLKPARTAQGWLSVPLDAAVRFTGLSKTRLRLSVDADSPILIRQGQLHIPEAPA